LTLKDSKLTHAIVCISSTAFEETHLAREFFDLCADLCNDPDFWEHHPKEN
jgi:hypothetical protein